MSFSQAEFKKIQKQLNVLEKQATQNIFIDPVNFTFEIRAKGKILRTYTPEHARTVRQFHQDNFNLHKLIMGPRGSQKSSGCCTEILFRTFLNPPCKDGVKRARWLIGRETYGELRTTTIKTFEHWFGFEELGWWIKQQPPIEAGLKYFDGECLTEIEFIFISFDNEKSAKKALSLELTGAYFNEAGKIAMAPMDEIMGSIGRYPAAADKITGRDYWHGIIYDSNAFEEYHPFHRRFVTNIAERHQFYRQPGGLIENSPGVFVDNPNAENIPNLVAGYYRNMALGKPLSFIRTQICNQFGTHEEGKAVHPEYDPAKHSVDDIAIDVNYPIYLGHDYGGTNATVIFQYIQGQLRAIQEIIGYAEGLTEFMRTKVKSWLLYQARGVAIKKSIGDPADNYSHDTATHSNKTVSDVLDVQTFPATTNNPKARIDAVDRLILKTLSTGERGLKISRRGCPILHAGLAGKYQLELRKMGGEERVVERPIKNEWSHSNDCLQYVALEIIQEDSRSVDKVKSNGVLRRSSGSVL